MKKTSLFYVLMLVVVSTAIIGLLQLDSSLPMPQGTTVQAQETDFVATKHESAFSGLMDGLRANFDHPLSHLFVQLLVIIAVSRVMGKIFTRLKRPAVVGEMAAGILLAPTLLARVPASTKFAVHCVLHSVFTRQKAIP